MTESDRKRILKKIKQYDVIVIARHISPDPDAIASQIALRDATIEALKDIDWEFTEKIDGTNIRIYWDGHKVNYYGRTDKAQIPSQLMNKLIELFGGNVNEEMFEQKFGEKEVMLIR